MKKIILILAIVIVVLFVGIAIVAGFYIGPIVKLGVEQVGPKVTQVSIKLDSVDVSLFSGSSTIKGLIIGNPQGYTTPQAISVGTIAVSLEPLSVTSNKIVVHSIQVESPEITFESGPGGNNLSKILNNVNAVSQNGPSTAGAANKPAPKIEVDDFLITGAKVLVSIPGLGSKEIPLPDIHLTDLGRGSDGLTPAQLTSAVLKAISSGTLKAVTSSAGGLSQGLENLGKGAGNTVGQSVNKITSSIGGLLGK